MASQGQQFPPQRQERQPGKEHVMDPNPQFTASEYKPSNKLQVYNLIANSFMILVIPLHEFFVVPSFNQLLLWNFLETDQFQRHA